MYYIQVPTYPDPGRCWDIVDKYNVTIFYTAPTLVRSLMRYGNEARIFFIHAYDPVSVVYHVYRLVPCTSYYVHV